MTDLPATLLPRAADGTHPLDLPGQPGSYHPPVHGPLELETGDAPDLLFSAPYTPRAVVDVAPPTADELMAKALKYDAAGDAHMADVFMRFAVKAERFAAR